MRMNALLFMVVVAGGVWWSVLSFSEEQGLNVYVLSVGQGDAIYVRAPSGRDMLIDTGPSDRVVRELESVMPSADRSLDILLLTHTDTDHVGGSAEVLSRLSVGMIIEGGGTASSSAYERYRQHAREQEILRSIVHTGDIIHLDDEVAFHVLLPRPEDVRAKTNGAKLGPNDIAVVGRLLHGTSSMLLTADIERRGEVALATSDADLSSDVLKVGHHGSRYSSWVQFLHRVQPQIAAISVGKNNYGHPSEFALDRLKSEKSQILRTDTMGRIHFRSLGEGFVVVEGD